MSDKSSIEWTDATWNPVTGCTKVSPGCDHCYAETFAERWRGIPGHYFENGFDVTLRPERLDQPIRWRKPRRIFVNSMSDLFHDDVPGEYIAQVFAAMGLARWHTFQLLTKRHGRMRSMLNSQVFRIQMLDAAYRMVTGESGAVLPAEVKQAYWARKDEVLQGERDSALEWPLPNVWVGVSVEDQKWADIRIPALLDTPAAVRWISAEPLLGPLRLNEWLGAEAKVALNWVVLGGESGPGARPMLDNWAREVRRQCEASATPFLFKQWGAWAPSPNGNLVSVVDAEGHEWPARMFRGPKAATGRMLDGQTWDQYPEAS